MLEDLVVVQVPASANQLHWQNSGAGELAACQIASFVTTVTSPLVDHQKADLLRDVMTEVSPDFHRRHYYRTWNLDQPDLKQAVGGQPASLVNYEVVEGRLRRLVGTVA